MKPSRHWLWLSVVFAATSSLAQWTQQFMTDLTKNNTGASNTFNGQICQVFDGVPRCGTNGVPAPKNIGLNVRITGGDDSVTHLVGKFPEEAFPMVFAHFQPWFCIPNNASGQPDPTSTKVCNGHTNVGYNSNDINQVRKQIDAMWRAGIFGVTIDWYGPDTPCSDGKTKCENQVTLKIRDELVTRCNQLKSTNPDAFCDFAMTVMIDVGALKKCGQDLNTTSCKIPAGYVNTDCSAMPFRTSGQTIANDKATCFITKHLLYNLDYVNRHYFNINGSPNPIYRGRDLEFFGVDGTNFNDGTCPLDLKGNQTYCKDAVIDWTWFRSQSSQSLFGNPRLIFRNKEGFTHKDKGDGVTVTNGAYSWVGDGTDANCQFTSDPGGLQYLREFYNTAKNFPSMTPHTIGSGYAGFNNDLTPWRSSCKKVHRRCGQTIMDSFHIPMDWNNATNNFYFFEIGFLEAVTWNDYDEGSAIEPGVDNCLILTPQLNGSVLSWTPTFSDPTGHERTIHVYEVYESPDDPALSPASIRMNAVWSSYTHDGADGSLHHQRFVDLATLDIAPGTHYMYVRAVGKGNIIHNKMSTWVKYVR